MTAAATLAAALLILVTACGTSGGDASAFVGIYSTTAHTWANSQGTPVSCTTSGQPVTPPTPFFKLAPDPFFNDPNMILLSNCTDAAGTTCTDTLTTMQPGGAGLLDTHANSQTGGGFMCQLYYTRAEATLTGTAVHIEVLDKYDSPNISTADCTLERAYTLADSANCRDVERWDGTRL